MFGKYFFLGETLVIWEIRHKNRNISFLICSNFQIERKDANFVSYTIRLCSGLTNSFPLNDTKGHLQNNLSVLLKFT